MLGKSRLFLPGSEICLAKKYDFLSEMGPYGSVGAHIKTGKRSMAQDHFKTPPDPKKGHGMTKKLQTSIKSSRVDQVLKPDSACLGGIQCTQRHTSAGNS